MTEKDTLQPSKGHLISEWLFGVLNCPKNQPKNLKDLKSGQIKKIKALYYVKKHLLITN